MQLDPLLGITYQQRSFVYAPKPPFVLEILSLYGSRVLQNSVAKCKMPAGRRLGRMVGCIKCYTVTMEACIPFPAKCQCIILKGDDKWPNLSF